MLSGKSAPSSSTSQATSQLLFKKNRQKARKSVNVLALTASVGGLLAYPRILSHLPFTNKPLTTKSNATSYPVEKVSGVSLSTGLAASRRAKSMSVLHKQNEPTPGSANGAIPAPTTTNLSSQSNNASSPLGSLRRNPNGKPNVTFAEQPEELVFRQPVTLPVFEDDMDQLDLSDDEDQDQKAILSTDVTSKEGHDGIRNDTVGGMAGTSARKPERVTQPLVAERRRIQSAPSIYMQQQSIPSSVPELLDDPLDDMFENDDADGLELNEWLVASVKAKAVQNAQREKQREIIEVENWDNDFEDLDAEGDPCNQEQSELSRRSLKIPEHLEQIQVNLKVDMLNMRKFALHMEDLRLLYLDVQDIEAGLREQYIRAVDEIRSRYYTIIHYASTLLDIADCTTGDSSDAPSPLSTEHMHTLADILAGPGGLNGTDKTFETLASHGSSIPVPPRLGTFEKNQLQQMLQEGHVMFGNEWMPMLLVRVGPIKQHLANYVNELRHLAVSAL